MQPLYKLLWDRYFPSKFSIPANRLFHNSLSTDDNHCLLNYFVVPVMKQQPTYFLKAHVCSNSGLGLAPFSSPFSNSGRYSCSKKFDFLDYLHRPCFLFMESLLPSCNLLYMGGTKLSSISESIIVISWSG